MSPTDDESRHDKMVGLVETMLKLHGDCSRPTADSLRPRKVTGEVVEQVMADGLTRRVSACRAIACLTAVTRCPTIVAYRCSAPTVLEEDEYYDFAFPLPDCPA